MNANNLFPFKFLKKAIFGLYQSPLQLNQTDHHHYLSQKITNSQTRQLEIKRINQSHCQAAIKEIGNADTKKKRFPITLQEEIATERIHGKSQCNQGKKGKDVLGHPKIFLKWPKDHKKHKRS